MADINVADTMTCSRFGVCVCVCEVCVCVCVCVCPQGKSFIPWTKLEMTQFKV